MHLLFPGSFFYKLLIHVQKQPPLKALACANYSHNEKLVISVFTDIAIIKFEIHLTGYIAT